MGFNSGFKGLTVATAFMHYRMRLSCNNLTYFILPKQCSYFIKSELLLFMILGINLYFYYWYFMSLQNQTGVCIDDRFGCSGRCYQSQLINQTQKLQCIIFMTQMRAKIIYTMFWTNTAQHVSQFLSKSQYTITKCHGLYLTYALAEQHVSTNKQTKIITSIIYFITSYALLLLL